MEKDAADWQALNGGEEAYVQLYVQAAKRAGFGKDRDLFMASGLLSYAGDKEMSWLNKTLHLVSKQLVYKEMFIPAQQLAGYNTEQQVGWSEQKVGCNIETPNYPTIIQTISGPHRFPRPSKITHDCRHRKQYVFCLSPRVS